MVVESKDLNLTRRLKMLSEETGYNILQRNGQRIFGSPPPGWTGQNGPDRGTEVYCYMLPRLTSKSVLSQKQKFTHSILTIFLN